MLTAKRLCAVLCAVAVLILCFPSCDRRETTAGERIAAALSVLSPLPAGNLYTSDAAIYESGYAREGLAADLFDLRGYGEIKKADGYAFYLGASPDCVFEISFFLCRDEAAVSDIADMCRYRRDFLARYGNLSAEDTAIMTRGRVVAAFFGTDGARAKAAFRAAFTG